MSNAKTIMLHYERKTCPFCGYSFMQDHPNQKFCSDRCEDAYGRNRYRTSRLDCKQTRPNSKLFEILQELNQYNKEHGTNLNYGKFVAMMDR